ncbi:uncharacterized protein LOC105831424 isoform X2 [Monomorium pharaonis]|uniref:uncharacterized protein LOC105831424 isoform X2 n=1 Tax=Monomorium pharaonis TaxID=307658 RepID=UPI00063F5249|nr:uncharacterized protein LOC105831424 isoform X2 [Monomorium pharaonis]
MGGSSSQKAPEQAESSNENSTHTVTAAVLPPFTTKENFITNWFSWKKNFLTFIKNVDQAEEKKQMWGLFLLNRMGPIGQEIHRSIEEIHETLPYYDKSAREDINTLIKKFDIYCVESVFKDKTRDGKNIDEYVNDLHLTAIIRNCIEPVEIVKEKIIQDISYVYHFTGKAALLIQSKGENLIPYLQSLDLQDVVLFWKQCENLMAQKLEEVTPKQDSYAKPAISIKPQDQTSHRRKHPQWLKKQSTKKLDNNYNQ